MLRLDKFLCETGEGTRSQVKENIRNGAATVNGVVVTEPEKKIDEAKDVIAFRGKVCIYRKYVYYMLNKPAGIVSAVRDNTCTTVTELLKDTGYQELFPIGRLDKDTEGLLLMTNDGELAHRLLSPKKHVNKVYYVELEAPLKQADVLHLSEGLDIGEKRLTLPASVEMLTERSIYLTITEGKFHQVKRMLRAAGNDVTYLKRVAMGGLKLDEALEPGEYRELSAQELEILGGY